jgi:hypothetical protein
MFFVKFFVMLCVIKYCNITKQLVLVTSAMLTRATASAAPSVAGVVTYSLAPISAMKIVKPAVHVQRATTAMI